MAAAARLSSSSSSSSASPATPAAQLPPGASVGAAGLPTEQFTVTLTGNYFNLSNFFNQLENFVGSDSGTLTIRGRLMTVNAINLVPGPTGFPQITATVSATTYIVPPTEGALRWRDTRRALRRPPARRPRLPDPPLNFDPPAAGDYPGAAMSVPRNMLKELLERKLWPIALVLIIALVAVPVLLTKKAPTDIVTPPTGPLPYSSGTTLPAISVQDDARQLEALRQGPQSVHPAARRDHDGDHGRGGRHDDHARVHGHGYEHRERRQRKLGHRRARAAAAAARRSRRPRPPWPRRTRARPRRPRRPRPRPPD